MEKFKNYLPVLSVTLLVLVAMIAGTLYDFTINNVIFVSNNAFGEIFEIIGKVPGYLLLGVSGAILFYARRKDVKWINILSGSLYAALSYLGFFMTFNAMTENFSLAVWLPCSILLGAAGMVLTFFLFRKVDCKRLAAFALITAITVIVTVLVVTLLKKVWGRIRYIEILTQDNPALFMPWYSPEPSRGGNSFPSGHAALASCVVALPLLCEIYPRLKNKKYVMRIIAFMIIILVAVSRMSMGMHYLTDVTVAFAVAFYTSLAAKKFVLRKSTMEALPDNRFIKLTMLER